MCWGSFVLGVGLALVCGMVWWGVCLYEWWTRGPH